MATNPYGTELYVQFLKNPTYIPPADLYPSQGCVPAGTVNGYGTALWIPDGYPIATQPYLDSYGRVILRPFRVTPMANITVQNQVTAYIGAALQYAVSQYAPVPYNVMAQSSMWSGPAVIQSYFIAPSSDMFFIQMRLTMGSWDPDWANPVFPQTTLADQAFQATKTLVMSTFTAGLSAVVPGLGQQLQNIINGVSKGGISGVGSLLASRQTNTQMQNETSALVASANPVSSLLSSLSGNEDILYLLAAVVIVIIMIIISSE